MRTVFSNGGVSVLNRWQDEICISFKLPLTAHVGRDVKVEFALKSEGLPKPAAGDYKVLGMMRAKSLNTTWDTVDTTADKSPNFTKTSLLTFKNVEFSGDGVSYDDDVHNQEALELAAR